MVKMRPISSTAILLLASWTSNSSTSWLTFFTTSIFLYSLLESHMLSLHSRKLFFQLLDLNSHHHYSIIHGQALFHQLLQSSGISSVLLLVAPRSIGLPFGLEMLIPQGPQVLEGDEWLIIHLCHLLGLIWIDERSLSILKSFKAEGGREVPLHPFSEDLALILKVLKLWAAPWGLEKKPNEEASHQHHQRQQ